jgi:hypothetical protein
MANTDSFIEEVNEELRRDRLFKMFRKWGWIPILVIIAIVAAAAWREYSLAQDRAAAEAFGDSLIAALDNDDASVREAALSEITPASEEARLLLAMLLAGEQATGDNATEAAASLRALAVNSDLPERYRDLALLKAHMLAPQDFDTAMAELTQLARPGRPYRPLAMEQQALLHVTNGDAEAAIALLRLLEEDSEATPGLQQRASQLIVALESGAALQDPAPVEDTAADATDAAPEDDAGPDAPTNGAEQDPATEGEEPPAEETAPTE